MFLLAQTVPATAPAKAKNIIEQTADATHSAFRDFINYPIAENEVWRWASILGLVLISLILSRIICGFLKRQAEKLDKIENRFEATSALFKLMLRPLQLFLITLALMLADDYDLLIISDEAVQDLYTSIFTTLMTLSVAWFLYRAIGLFDTVLLKLAGRTQSNLDDQLVPLIRKSLRIVLVLMTILFIAQNIFSLDVGAFVAGLGLGGLAFALAAKDMLANLFGSLAIFADRPFHLGERVKIAGQDGIITEVGFRSTRMQLLNGHRVSIPNGEVANGVIENISKREFLKQSMEITLTYDTTPKMMRRAIEILNEMFEARKEHWTSEKPPRVHFANFNADSLGITVSYWYSPAEWWDFHDFNHEFNMELLERFNAEGLEFAFPTQTLYLKNDDPETPDKQQ